MHTCVGGTILYFYEPEAPRPLEKGSQWIGNYVIVCGALSSFDYHRCRTPLTFIPGNFGTAMQTDGPILSYQLLVDSHVLCRAQQRIIPACPSPPRTWSHPGHTRKLCPQATLSQLSVLNVDGGGVNSPLAFRPRGSNDWARTSARYPANRCRGRETKAPHGKGTMRNS